MASTPKTKSDSKPKAKAASTKSPAKRAPALGKVERSKGKMKDDMKNFKEKATDATRNAAERGKDKASEAVNSFGKLIRDSASSIDDNVGKNYGDYARSAADAVEGFADKMSSKDIDDIASDARDFVKKSPAIAIGAAAAVGFVLARLVRSGKDEA
jgi:ElaB/YqjD/DUF883 family membrane-anchored ribosome-binding protein